MKLIIIDRDKLNFSLSLKDIGNRYIGVKLKPREEKRIIKILERRGK
jgi:hypothetical protein